MAYDKNTMMGYVAAGEKKGGSRAALGGVLQALDRLFDPFTQVAATLGALVPGGGFAGVMVAALGTAQLQDQLDQLTPHDAEPFTDALNYAITQVPGTCYTGVVSLEAKPNDTTAAFHGFEGTGERRRGRFTSPTWTFSAEVYCIAGSDIWEIGLIQDCNSAVDASIFSDGWISRQVPSKKSRGYAPHGGKWRHRCRARTKPIGSDRMPRHGCPIELVLCYTQQCFLSVMAAGGLHKNALSRSERRHWCFLSITPAGGLHPPYTGMDRPEKPGCGLPRSRA